MEKCEQLFCRTVEGLKYIKNHSSDRFKNANRYGTQEFGFLKDDPNLHNPQNWDIISSLQEEHNQSREEQNEIKKFVLLGLIDNLENEPNPARGRFV